MHWHAQNAGEPTFDFWEIFKVLWLRGSQVIYIFVYNVYADIRMSSNFGTKLK